MDTASLSSEDCPFEEHWLKFTPSIVPKSWRRYSSGSSCRYLIWLKGAMLALFDCPTLFCVYLWGMGPFSVQPSRVLTPYGVAVGSFVNCLGTVVNASATISIPIRLSLIVGNLMFWRWAWSADLIQHFNLNSWHPQLLHYCCVHRDSEQILYKAPMPIMTSALLTECSPWSEASGRVISLGCGTWSASATFCVIWVFSLPLSSIAYVSMQRSVLQSVAGMACNFICGLIKEISCWLL